MKAEQYVSDKNSHTEQIRVRGIVQGVGFRPTVWQLAQRFGLSGAVSNDGDGVLIKAHGDSKEIEAFVIALDKEKPKLARIDSIERNLLRHKTVNQQKNSREKFKIILSKHSNANTGVTADAATCDSCLNEIFDENNRRYYYPFTNCTHCGPRLSIIRGIPYDRAQTSMDKFTMCPDCQREYESSNNRRFHAQPNACPDCGPSIWLEDSHGNILLTPDKNRLQATEIFDRIASFLSDQSIIAVKGIGGIHLAVNACDDKAVVRLREHKQRPRKPFALMAKNIKMIERYCQVNQAERELLKSPAAPIVLLKKREQTDLANSIAPRQSTLGFMLPYSPIHHLLMCHFDKPLVLTSGNATDAPQCIDNEDARKRLNPIADYLLLHDRVIENRVDDSVLRLMAGEPQFLRRARGYAPEYLPLPQGFENLPEIFAMGGELKNTFCLLKNKQVVLSQYMGDLENYDTYQDYCHNIDLYQKLFEHHTKHLAIDSHPEYLSSKTAHNFSKEQQVLLHSVQHHHAHIASCLADNGYALENKPVLGITLDGLGFGDDNYDGSNNEQSTLWGGEFLIADYCQSQRLAHFKPVALLGGTVAMKQPWRNAYTHLQSCLGWDWVEKKYNHLEFVQFIKNKPLKTFDAMLAQNINCPLASSAGRLFDAVAAAVGICTQQIEYEGQAAIELEASIDGQRWALANKSPYKFSHENRVLDPTPMWEELLHDLSEKKSVGLISARFHKGLSIAIQHMAVDLIKQSRDKHTIDTIALSGGVFQNKTLFEDVKLGLPQHFTVLSHRSVPANDGGLALGQAMVVAARLLKIKSH